MPWNDRYEEAMRDEEGARYGDPRRCPRHPSAVTSSPDGMHDAPCGRCEHEADLEAEELRRYREPEVYLEGCEPCPGDDGLSDEEMSGPRSTWEGRTMDAILASLAEYGLFLTPEHGMPHRAWTADGSIGITQDTEDGTFTVLDVDGMPYLHTDDLHVAAVTIRRRLYGRA